jgi:hypothetical protein
MPRPVAIIAAAAAALVTSALIAPTSGLAAPGYTSVINDNGWPMVEGSGRIKQQTRAVGRFDRIEAFGAENIEVRFGPRPSLVIAADDNVLPLLTTEVENGTLKLKSRGSYRTRSPIKAWITTPSLSALSTFGSGTVNIHQVNNGRLRLAIHGSSYVVATGRTDQLDVAIYGSGDARLSGLAARDVKAGLFGSGQTTVRPSGRLDASIFGSGVVRYVGKPQQIEQSRFGSGRIVAGN